MGWNTETPTEPGLYAYAESRGSYEVVRIVLGSRDEGREKLRVYWLNGDGTGDHTTLDDLIAIHYPSYWIRLPDPFKEADLLSEETAIPDVNLLFTGPGAVGDQPSDFPE
jgi:hypothetical protein